MTLRAAVARALVLAVIGGVALVAAPAPAATPAEHKYGTKIMRKVNKIRVNHDRVRLKRDNCLQRFAAKQARKMAKQRRIFHQDPQRVINRCGLSWYGENVAWGPFPAKGLVKRWMKSKSHRANILTRKYRITGVAARRAGGSWWAAQVFGRR